MGELRKDYILDKWVIISEKRKKRPHEYKEKPPLVVEKVNYFAPGNEKLTPTEIGREINGGHSSVGSPVCKEMVNRGLAIRSGKGHYRLIDNDC